MGKLLLVFLVILLLTGCVADPIPETTLPQLSVPETTVPETTAQTHPTIPEHSPLYLPEVSQEDVIRYFREVCLDAEIINSGDPSVLQKWAEPIQYRVYGDPTGEDLAVLKEFVQWLNALEGFPGMAEPEEEWAVNYRIYFCSHEEMLELMGDDFYGMDGSVTFWYDEDQIYTANVCIRSDINQYTRNSVILEEIYNSLGPIQDTALREDSIIYTHYSEPQKLTQVDELLLKLLYHPNLKCGMTAEECDRVIRELYY